MTDSSPAAPPLVRRQTLVLVGVALAALLVYMMWPAAARPPAPSNPPREQRKQAAKKGADTPEALTVDLGKLAQAPPAPAAGSRNPFRFYVPPPPPPPPPPVVARNPVGNSPTGGPPVPPGPPPLPPIPLKFIGTLEVKGRKVAIFTSNDGRGMPVYAAEGDLVLGQYRVVKIGVESVTVEYLDGRGRQTIPMRG
jgi:hypothetical protein